MAQGSLARRKSVQCLSPKGLHRIAYLEWGDAANPRVVVCAHGLTRTARDFDALARALCDEFRVVCPDMAGRGDSDWLADPAFYAVPQYLSDMVTLIARLDVASVNWVGTSMGGLIGMALASLANAPVRRMVLNDVGAVITKASLDRIGGYLGRTPPFPDLQAAEAYVRGVAASFGPHSDAEWRFLAETWVRRNPDGTYRAHYDPRIAEAFTRAEADVELWPVYDAIRCPTLLLRGARSDLLPEAAAREMARRGPRAQLVEFPGVGHAPTLMHPDQIAPVRTFLLGGGS